MNIAHLGSRPSICMSFLTNSPQVFLPTMPTHLTPATFIFLQANTKSSFFTLMLEMLKPPQICHTSLYQPCSEYPEDCTNSHWTLYPSTTLHASTSPSYTLSSSDHANTQKRYRKWEPASILFLNKGICERYDLYIRSYFIDCNPACIFIRCISTDECEEFDKIK